MAGAGSQQPSDEIHRIRIIGVRRGGGQVPTEDALDPTRRSSARMAHKYYSAQSPPSGFSGTLIETSWHRPRNRMIVRLTHFSLDRIVCLTFENLATPDQIRLVLTFCGRRVH